MGVGARGRSSSIGLQAKRTAVNACGNSCATRLRFGRVSPLSSAPPRRDAHCLLIERVGARRLEDL
eukprot:6193114-Pleurochrysis_carterae.AAC.1